MGEMRIGYGGILLINSRAGIGRGTELPVNLVLGTGCRRGAHRCLDLLAPHDAFQPRAAHQTCRRAAGDAKTFPLQLVPDLADAVDPVGLAMIVDKRDHRLHRRSSSAWAKYADALRSISLAWRNSRFSRSSTLRRSRSSVVRPWRRPRSRSSCRTQLDTRINLP